MTSPITGRTDRRILLKFGAFTSLFLAFGIFIEVKQPGEWKPLVIIAVFFAIPWTLLLSVKFTFDETELTFSGFVNRFTVAIADISAVDIVSERLGGRRKRNFARLYLILRDGKRTALDINNVSVPVVREFCAMLCRRGVHFGIQEAPTARLMASKFLPQTHQPP